MEGGFYRSQEEFSNDGGFSSTGRGTPGSGKRGLPEASPRDHGADRRRREGTGRKEELEEDLTINSPVATLALKYNSDPKSVYNSGSNIDVMKADHSVKKQQEKQEAKPTQEEQLTDPSKLPGMKRDS